MKEAIRWAVKNGAGINVVVATVLMAGLGCFWIMRRETFPEFQLEIILVSVPYPGATPDEVESGICQKIEEGIQAISGIKKVTSVCREGSGFTLAELNSSVKDPQRVLSEIRSAVDRISVFFPERSEKSTVEQITFRSSAIQVAVLGPEQLGVGQDRREAELRLRDYAETVREQLLELPSVSQVQIQNAKPYQIDVEVDENALRKYGLTLAQVAQTLRRENIELPSGQLKSEGQEILLRGKNKRELGEEIQKLPVITKSNGVVLRVEDIGKVQDGFDDVTAITEVNGRPAINLTVQRTSDEDLIRIADDVKALIAKTRPPEGFGLETWGDESAIVRDRLEMLRSNGIQGAIIVFLLLAMFLNLRLAFWVAMGIPISLMGAGIVLLYMDQTLNMLTMFAFLMAVGIVVDDGIVIGENIYSHRSMGKSFQDAAVDGVSQVLPSVFSSVATTIICFVPLFYVSGVMGKFISAMPAAIIAMLIFSLAEATFALPGHLSHEPHKPKTPLQKLVFAFSIALIPIERLFDWISVRANAILDRVGEAVFGNLLRLSLRFPLLPISALVLMVCLGIAAVRSGMVPFVFFPELDGTTIIGQVIYPDGTPVAVTSESARRMEAAVRQLSEEIYQEESQKGTNKSPLPLNASSPKGPVVLTSLSVGSAASGQPGAGDRISGSHVGQIEVELHDPSLRNVSSTELIRRWREAAGVFPGAERVTFSSANMGPGGKALEFKILGSREDSKAIEDAVELAKAELATYAGVRDIRDDSNPGKFEFQFKIKERAEALGISVSDLSETIRNAYYGAEVMRLQRGRHEVKLMVRYPQDQRRSLADFQEIRIRGADKIERPITELADITITRGYSEINRLDQLRSITVTADVDVTKANAALVASKLRESFIPKLAEKYPTLRVRWEGQQQETADSFMSLVIGFGLAMLSMYALLVFEFGSYLQPFIILMIIPFSIIGAIFGHAFMGLPLTLFSMFGMVTLAGVVVNDSIVLVDFINQCIREGMSVDEALETAGSRRLRAIFLTSVTTIAGLAPILSEKSLQAQVVIPMATSLAFGLLTSTLLVLIVVPFFYKMYSLVVYATKGTKIPIERPAPASQLAHG